jgi:[acyl-carrier-protein] S-malonyltransferase
MAAVMGLDRARIAEACLEAAESGQVQVANLNAPGQTVIAGTTAAVKRAMELCRAKGAKRAVLLPVSAPFHSALLAPAARRLDAVLQTLSFSDLAVPLVTNVDAEPLTDGSRLRDTLVRQVTSPVRWEDVVLRLAREGAATFVEIGPGKVLSGLIKRIAPDARVANVEDRASLAAALEAVR